MGVRGRVPNPLISHRLTTSPAGRMPVPPIAARARSGPPPGRSRASARRSCRGGCRPSGRRPWRVRQPFAAYAARTSRMLPRPPCCRASPALPAPARARPGRVSRTPARATPPARAGPGERRFPSKRARLERTRPRTQSRPRPWLPSQRPVSRLPGPRLWGCPDIGYERPVARSISAPSGVSCH